MINYKLFPDIMLEDGKVYSNFNSEVSFIDAKDNIPFIRAYEHIGCKKNIFLVGGASIGKSTSLKVFRQKAHITKRMVYLECRGINEIDIRKLISDIADENIELVVFDALDELQRIVSYKPNDSKPPLYAIDSEQMKYINYFHAAYIKYILLSLIDGERSMNGFSLAYEMTVGSWIERLFDIDSEYIKAEAYYFAGQLIDNEPENIKNNVLSVLDKAFLKTHNNYSNLLSLVCGLRHGILADEQFFRLFSEGTIKLSAENRLYNVYGLRHFIVSNYIDVIGDRTFFSCCELKKITIGSQVCHIGVAAFYRCRLLEKVEIADGVEFVGNSAFWECSELPQIELPDTIVGIGKCAFFGCKDLKSIYIPRRVSKIDLWAFSGCTSLERIEVSLNIAPQLNTLAV